MSTSASFVDDKHIVAPTVVYNYWKELDLETLRSKLDEQGLAIAKNQESSLNSRKQLSEKTKEFKRSVPQELFKQVATLLKSYQEEIDALTTRAKQGENAFLSVFKQLYEAPDPAPAIAYGLEISSKAAELEVQNTKVLQELSEYRAESKELKNQDLTIRRLEERIRLLEAEVSEKDAEMEAARIEAAAELEARNADDAQAREERLQAELERAEAALEAMRRMHQATQSQLFNLQEKGVEAAEAARAEAALAAEEVDRAEERLALLSQERDALLEKIQKKNTGNGLNDNEQNNDSESMTNTAALTALREELRTQREINARLQTELQSSMSREYKNTSLTVLESKIQGLQASLQATEAHAAALEAELSGRPTLQELEQARQQIRVLRAVVHNSVDNDDDIDGGYDDTSGNTTNGNAIGSFESALLAKNRHLEHTLTIARLEASEAATAAETATQKLSEVELELERHKSLVEKLEEDLMVLEKVGASTIPTPSDSVVASDATTNQPNNQDAGLVSPVMDVNSDSMVSVLSAQRDRLRARVHELESASAASTVALTKAKQDLAACRADNIALVEQLRYVQQGYGAKSAGTGGGTARGTGHKQDIESGAGVVRQYMKEYEERMNPLNDFRNREKEARRRALPLQDRAAVALGSALVSGSRMAKSVIIVYALALHFIAFLVLAGFSHRHADKMDALEDMCAQLQLAGVNTQDPVIGGSVAG